MNSQLIRFTHDIDEQEQITGNISRRIIERQVSNEWKFQMSTEQRDCHLDRWMDG